MPSPRSGPLLLVFGAGFLGRQLVAATRGPVRVASRNPPQDLGPNVTTAAVDLTRANAAQMADVLRGADAMVTAYASGGQQDRRALFVGAAQRIADALPSSTVQRLVVISSTSAIGSCDRAVTEDDAPPPDTQRGAVQVEAEQILAGAAQRLRRSCIILRLAGLYGPDRPIARIYRARTPAPLPGHGHTATNLIHVEDAVAAVQAALELPEEVSTLVHVADDDHRSRRDMYAHAARLRGEPPPTWEESPPPGPAGGKVVVNTRMKALLGITLAHPQHVLS